MKVKVMTVDNNGLETILNKYGYENILNIITNKDLLFTVIIKTEDKQEKEFVNDNEEYAEKESGEYMPMKEYLEHKPRPQLTPENIISTMDMMGLKFDMNQEEWEAIHYYLEENVWLHNNWEEMRSYIEYTRKIAVNNIIPIYMLNHMHKLDGEYDKKAELNNSDAKKVIEYMTDLTTISEKLDMVLTELELNASKEEIAEQIKKCIKIAKGERR